MANDLSCVSQASNEHSGIRPESIEIVRRQRAIGAPMRPIEIDVYPDVGAVVVDGRHRLVVASELGDENIDAVIRVYGLNGDVISKFKRELAL